MTDPLAALDADRLRSGWSLKWGDLADSELPAWIAEGDAAVAPAVVSAVEATIGQGALTYPPHDAAAQVADAYAHHVASRHDWRIDPAAVMLFTDVVQPASFAIDLLSERGAAVMIHTPCYGALESEIRELGRRPHPLPWYRVESGWTTSIDDVVAGCDAGARLLLLVNPHNPTGRVWTAGELAELAAVVVERDLLIVSDEMFADLTLDDATHLPFAGLGAEVAARTVTVTSAAKSHNLGGVRAAVAHVGSSPLLDPFRRIAPAQIGQVSNLGLIATTAAWCDGDEWLDSYRDAIADRRDQAVAFLGEHLPEADVVAPEAGFMLWVDCRPLDLPVEPAEFFARRALVRLAPGSDFGPGGEGFVRITVATSAELLGEMLERMVTAVDLWRSRR